jgi:hypothetical protein
LAVPPVHLFIQLFSIFQFRTQNYCVLLTYTSRLHEDLYFQPAIRKVMDEVTGKKELLVRSTAWDSSFKVSTTHISRGNHLSCFIVRLTNLIWRSPWTNYRYIEVIESPYLTVPCHTIVDCFSSVVVFFIFSVRFFRWNELWGLSAMESSSNVAGNIGRCSVRLHCVLARRNEGTCHVVCLCSMSVWVAFVIAELNSIRASKTSFFISLKYLRFFHFFIVVVYLTYQKMPTIKTTLSNSWDIQQQRHKLIIYK